MHFLRGKHSFMSSFLTKFLVRFHVTVSRFSIFFFHKCRTLEIVFSSPFRHLSFFLNFNFLDQVLPHLAIFSFPRLQKSSFLTKVLPLVYFSRHCFLNFTMLLLISKKKNTCKNSKQFIFLGVSMVLCQVL
jgi:hypothetical protein